MIASISTGMDFIGESILNLVIPHHKNNHRPLAIQSSGLFLFLVVLLFSQLAVNFFSSSSRLLGYATNISVSQVINFSNDERKNAGLPTLSENSNLSKAAAFKAKDMLEKDYWSHFAPDGTSPWYFFGLVGYQYSTAGENLARDFATSGGVVTAWMNSPGHKANILNPNFTEIGVAVVDGDLLGEDTTLVVQLFGKPVALATTETGSGSSSPSPAKVKADLNLAKSKNQAADGNTTISKGSETALSGPVDSSSSESTIGALVKNTSQSQRVTIALLILISVLLLIDSFVIFRKRYTREGSHSFVHASVIILLAISSLLYGWGTTL
jgi:uncharacterized protein YkwD